VQQPQVKSGGTIQPLTSTSRPNADQLQLMIMRVQAALYSKGYDPGAIDGVLGETTRQALRQFQRDRGIPATGSMTTETLNALEVRL
jgi:His-Xaa-Ser repeat protein HxsA